LFTNTDNPHSASQHKQHQARSKAADLGQVDIDVELLHMGNNFDPSLFYKVREDISMTFSVLLFALFKYKIGQKISSLMQTL
jgi:hypothetical protein